MVTIRVNIYADSGGAGIRPGARVFADSNIIPITALNNASPTFKLNTPAVLAPGRYWISVMTVHSFAASGQWFWSTRATLGAVCVLRDPGNLLVGGTAWRVTTTAPNQSVQFRLRGAIVGAGSPLYSRCKSVNLPIPDNNNTGVTDTFVVAGLPTTALITRVQVTMDSLIHTWVGDLRITVNKGATTVTLCRNPGAGLNGSSGDNFIGTTFSDTARYNIDSILTTTGQGQLSAPYTGYFRTNSNPPNTAITSTPLSLFNGVTNPNGVWTFNWKDSALQDVGTVRRYCVMIDYVDYTGITQTGTEIPNKYFVDQNYPNPFNPVTNIKFGLPNAGNVKLVVFDILGREVATLVNEFKAAGQYTADFDASMLSSGAYFYRIEAGDFVETKKMLLVK
jgi:subtilisin-like proprotein convertase family protein